MLERQFSSIFGRWAKAHLQTPAAFELKITKGPSLPFDRLEPHQELALKHAKHAKLYFKIPDGSFSQTPFDSFMLYGVPAYVVIRYPSGAFYLVDIDEFIYAREHSTRKSLLEEEAKEIASYSYPQ